MIVEHRDRHGGVVEQNVQDERGEPDKHRAEHRRHPENSLEVQAPHHKL